MNKKRAFTLIELLVVIAIIGILSGFIVISMNGATSTAKDAKRKANIDTLRKALLLYKVQNGSYPVEATSCSVGSTCTTLASALVPTYLSAMPTDPNSGSYYSYISATGTDFTVGSTLSTSAGFSYTASTGFGTTGGGGGGGTYTSTCTAATNAQVTCTEVTISPTEALYRFDYVSGAGTTTWTVPNGISSVRYLVIAGGAGGWNGWYGGGGGAGGMLSNSNFAVTPSNSMTVTVGAGGAGGSNGSNSVFGSITTTGGGTAGCPGVVGGSGGGATACSGSVGGAGTSGQGYAGGTPGYGCGYGNDSGGGGGGAGGVGGNSPGCSTAGVGGPGRADDITGSSVTYAGGGGGGGATPAAGGSGGGGNGNGGAATNYGSGGAGTTSAGTGGAGYKGVVMVRFTHP